MQNNANSIESVLVDLVQKYGGAELYKKENARKLNGLLKDMVGDFTDELRLLTRVVPEGFQEILYKADKSSAEERKGALAECKIRFVDEIFLQKEKAEEAVNILAAGLGWTIKLEEDSKSSSNSINDKTFTDTTDYSDDFLRNLTIIQLLALENKTHNAKVQFMLGWRYAEGKIVDQDYEKSNEWYRKASEHAEAFVQKKQENTEPVHKASEEPVINIDEYDDDYLENLSLKELLDLEHKTHNANVQTWIGWRYNEGDGAEQSYEKALKWFLKAAQQGKTNAQYNLGIMYYSGQGVEQNYSKAFECFFKAAGQDNADAQVLIGNMYKNGKGVEKDYAKAVEWYLKAARQGDANAQVHLGDMYKNGKGVKKDTAKAVEWYEKAACQGIARAQNELGIYYNQSSKYKKALEWFQKAADQGFAAAQYYLGYMYQCTWNYTDDVPHDMKKSFYWYQKAAEQGVVAAQIKVGECFSLGSGVSMDGEKAFEWFLKAAEQGDVDGQIQVALYYDRRNESAKAVEWYQKAADNGDHLAKGRLQNIKNTHSV